MASTQRVLRLRPEELLSFAVSLASDFLGKPNYLTLDGRPVVAILNVTDFEDAYGVQGFRLLTNVARNELRRHTGVDPYILGVLAHGRPETLSAARRTTCDGLTAYAFLPNWGGPPVQQYEVLVRQRVAEWYRIQAETDVPFFPVVCAGWDASCRGDFVGDLRRVRGFPWRPVVVGNSPAAFGDFIDAALTFNRVTKNAHNLVLVHAWNEWSEGSAVEPSDEHGHAFVHEIAKRASPGRRFESIE